MILKLDVQYERINMIQDTQGGFCSFIYMIPLFVLEHNIPQDWSHSPKFLSSYVNDSYVYYVIVDVGCIWERYYSRPLGWTFKDTLVIKLHQDILYYKHEINQYLNCFHMKMDCMCNYIVYDMVVHDLCILRERGIWFERVKIDVYEYYTVYHIWKGEKGFFWDNSRIGTPGTLVHRQGFSHGRP
jgi:hypothetical protein